MFVCQLGAKVAKVIRVPSISTFNRGYISHEDRVKQNSIYRILKVEESRILLKHLSRASNLSWGEGGVLDG